MLPQHSGGTYGYHVYSVRRGKPRTYARQPLTHPHLSSQKYSMGDLRSNDSIDNRQAPIERQLRDLRRRKLPICIPKLHDGSVRRRILKLVRPHAIIPRLLDRVLNRCCASQINSFANNEVSRRARCIGLKDEFANVGLVAESGGDAVFVADDLFLHTLSHQLSPNITKRLYSLSWIVL